MLIYIIKSGTLKISQLVTCVFSMQNIISPTYEASYRVNHCTNNLLGFQLQLFQDYYLATRTTTISLFEPYLEIFRDSPVSFLMPLAFSHVVYTIMLQYRDNCKLLS